MLLKNKQFFYTCYKVDLILFIFLFVGPVNMDLQKIKLWSVIQNFQGSKVSILYERFEPYCVNAIAYNLACHHFNSLT